MTKDEAITWFKSFINEVDTQDNLWTAKPVQFLLQKKREYVGDSDYERTTKQFTHPEMDGESFDTLEDCIESLVNNGYAGEDLQQRIDEIKELDMGHYWETAQSFFTKRGYEEHVRSNRHNLGEYRTYVVHAYRNWENHELFKAIRAVISEGILK